MSKSQQYEKFLAEKIQQGKDDIAQGQSVTLEQSRQAIEQLLIRKEQAHYFLRVGIPFNNCKINALSQQRA